MDNYLYASICEYANGYYGWTLEPQTAKYDVEKRAFLALPFRRSVSGPFIPVAFANYDPITDNVIFKYGADVPPLERSLDVFRVENHDRLPDAKLDRLLAEEEKIAQERTAQERNLLNVAESLDRLLVEKELKYNTALDPISPDFNPNTWVVDDPVGQARDIMEMFLPITKETIIGDIITVPEHRCDIYDTQATLASQFMAAYNIDVLKAHVFTGMTITFRKAD